ncbi:hypothetical protein KFL_006530030 [Klebsormidium nitens]|uniref:WW domain-containing protein n=1 Tax=Klebsormidium nitens TaxID=105231 RepID=A0A1Y1IPJ0_KLENI|nr:hypothetical protein KFL_006530030 [Klebsormidium nitens]|eukprot:GAQ90537.1 hypothetical protein KFL_006530030 [Klebsormidium nitens]
MRCGWLSTAAQNRGHSSAALTITRLVLGSPNCSENPLEKPPADPPSSDWGLSFFTVSFFGVSLLSAALMFCARDATLFTLALMLVLAVVSFTIAYNPLEEDAKKGEFQPRQPGLPPGWHNLYHREEQLTFYYNSETKVSQWEAPELLISPAAPDVSQTSDDLVASYPLPALVLALSPLPFGVESSTFDFFQWTVTVGVFWESVLCLALLASIGYEIQSLMATLKRAARARLPPCEPAGDSSLITNLFCALCPSLGWRLHPFAFGLSFRRIVILPLPSKVPFPVPVPRWELLPGTLVAFLYIAPMILPLVRCLAAAAERSQALGPSTLLRILLSSPVVYVGVFAAVATALIRWQKEAYERALAEFERTSERTELQETMSGKIEGGESRPGVLDDAFENLLKKDFDARLGGGGP